MDEMKGHAIHYTVNRITNKSRHKRLIDRLIQLGRSLQKAQDDISNAFNELDSITLEVVALTHEKENEDE